jgi:hypothetical protein
MNLARLVSLLALAGTIVPPLLHLWGWLDLSAVKSWMLAAAVAWFTATPLWMDRTPEGEPPPGEGTRR